MASGAYANELLALPGPGGAPLRVTTYYLCSVLRAGRLSQVLREQDVDIGTREFAADQSAGWQDVLTMGICTSQFAP